MQTRNAGLVALIAISFLAVPAAVGQDAPITVTFDRYSTAHATRGAMEGNGARAGAIRFEEGHWRFVVFGIRGGPATTHEPSEGCTTRATAAGAGVTGCHLFSMAQAERNLMEADGWVITVRGRFNPETGLWEFGWRRGAS